MYFESYIFVPGDVKRLLNDRDVFKWWVKGDIVFAIHAVGTNKTHAARHPHHHTMVRKNLNCEFGDQTLGEFNNMLCL